jgi:hypothetical protein
MSYPAVPQAGKEVLAVRTASKSRQPLKGGRDKPQTIWSVFPQTEAGILGVSFCESCQTRVFVWFSTLIFPFYKMLIMNRLEFS